MKFKLPKALMVAVLASAAAMTANANSTTKVMTPIDIIQVDTDTTADQDILDRISAAKADKYSAVVKDGEGSLTVSGATLNLHNTFIAREGKTIINKDTTITSDVSGNSMLMVGGKNASLELNGAKIIADSAPGNDSIIIGGRDGDGTLLVTNGAELKNNHGLFAGGQSRDENFENTWHPTFQHVCGSYTDQSEETLYRSEGTFKTELPVDSWSGTWGSVEYTRLQSHASITVNGGSKLLVGYGMIFCNTDVLLTGENTELIEGHRKVNGANAEHWSLWGDTVYGGTDITITDGATMTANNNVLMSVYGGKDIEGFHGETKVTIADGGTLNSLRETYIGAESYGAKTEIIVKNGGVANMTDASAGFQEINGTRYDGTGVYDAEKGDIATITVEKGGKYTGSSLKLHEGSTLTNGGEIKLTAGVKVMESENGVVSETENVASILSVEGGKLVNNGSLSAESINIIAGSLTNTGTIEGTIFVDGGTFTMADGAVAAGLTATSGTIYLNGDVTFTGAVVLGSPVSVATLMTLSGESDALTLYINQGSTINADELTVGNGTSIAVILNEDETYTAGMELFTVTGSDADTVSAIESALGTNVTVYENGNVEGTGTQVADATGSITTNVVPEPATATLSLLALAGLAARRRRK